MLQSESVPLFIAGQTPYLAPLMCVKRPYLAPLLITRPAPDGGGPFVGTDVPPMTHAAFNSHGGGVFLIQPLSIETGLSLIRERSPIWSDDVNGAL